VFGDLARAHAEQLGERHDLGCRKLTLIPEHKGELGRAHAGACGQRCGRKAALGELALEPVHVEEQGHARSGGRLARVLLSER
jgi:hypothetical protein